MGFGQRAVDASGWRSDRLSKALGIGVVGESPEDLYHVAVSGLPVEALALPLPAGDRAGESSVDQYGPAAGYEHVGEPHLPRAGCWTDWEK